MLVQVSCFFLARKINSRGILGSFNHTKKKRFDKANIKLNKKLEKKIYKISIQVFQQEL